jgi:hypothetical protein
MTFKNIILPDITGMTLTTTYRSFWKRIRKEFGYVPIGIIAIGIFTYATGSDLGNYIIFAIGSMVFWTIRAFVRGWHLVHTVEFIEEKIVIKGETVNTPWDKEFDIKTSTIEIDSKSDRGQILDIEYHLRIQSGDRSQSINRTFNWDDTSVLTIFYMFKRIKGEEINPNERDYLDGLEQKAKGFSTSFFNIPHPWRKK